MSLIPAAVLPAQAVPAADLPTLGTVGNTIINSGLSGFTGGGPAAILSETGELWKIVYEKDGTANHIERAYTNVNQYAGNYTYDSYLFGGDYADYKGYFRYDLVLDKNNTLKIDVDTWSYNTKTGNEINDSYTQTVGGVVSVSNNYYTAASGDTYEVARGNTYKTGDQLVITKVSAIGGQPTWNGHSSIGELRLDTDKKLYVDNVLWLTDVENVITESGGGNALAIQRTDGNIYLMNTVGTPQLIKVWGGYTRPVLDIRGDYVYGFTIGSTYNSIAGLFGEVPYTLKDKDGNDISGNQVIGTGSALTFGENTYTVVIMGDTDGNGIITGNDYIIAMNMFLETITPADTPEAFFLAADVDKNSTLSGNDYLIIMKHFLGLIDINQI